MKQNILDQHQKIAIFENIVKKKKKKYSPLSMDNLRYEISLAKRAFSCPQKIVWKITVPLQAQRTLTDYWENTDAYLLAIKLPQLSHLSQLFTPRLGAYIPIFCSEQISKKPSVRDSLENKQRRRKPHALDQVHVLHFGFITSCLAKEKGKLQLKEFHLNLSPVLHPCIGLPHAGPHGDIYHTEHQEKLHPGPWRQL